MVIRREYPSVRVFKHTDVGPEITEVTEWVDFSSISISETLGRTVDTCSFNFANHDGRMPNVIYVGVEIIVALVDDNGTETERLFGGVVATVEDTVEGVIHKGSVNAQDYTIVLSKALVPPYIYRSIEFRTDRDIIKISLSRHFAIH